MDFSYEELARLNKIIGIALRSGKVEIDEISESIHKKISVELLQRNALDVENKG